MNAIFQEGDVINFYGIKGIITDVKQINDTTFEYTINDTYKTIQETDWEADDWEDYIIDKPYHTSYHTSYEQLRQKYLQNQK